MIVWKNSFCQFPAKLRIFGYWFSHPRLEKSIHYSFGPPGIIKIHFQAPILVFCNCLFFKILRIDFFQEKCKKIQIFWFKLVDTPNSSKFSEFFFPFNPRFCRYRTFKKKKTIIVIYIWDKWKVGHKSMFSTFTKNQFFRCQMKTRQKFEFFGKAWVLGCWNTQNSLNLKNYLRTKILSLKSLG